MRTKLKKIIIAFLVLVILLIISYIENGLIVNTIDEQNPKGTRCNPYLIQDERDLQNLAEQVNDGRDFEGCYFVQTNNIDLEGQAWIPIGKSEKTPFNGIYDGQGHTISNLCIDKPEDKKAYALFGHLGGAIANLGIESGRIDAWEGAAFATNAEGESALIINCYNKADIYGETISGIASNFENGDIVSCVNMGNLYPTRQAYEITACAYNVKIYYCQGTMYPIAPDSIFFDGSFNDSQQVLLQPDNIWKRNLEISLAQYLYAQRYDIQLLERACVNGSLGFGTYDLIWYVVRFVNYYLLTFIVIVYGMYYAQTVLHSDKEFEEKKKICKHTLIIFGIVAMFIDMAVVGKGMSNITIGNVIFIVLVNLIFTAAMLLYISYEKSKILKKVKTVPIALVVCMVIVVVLEMMQWRLVPKYDGSLYYGSFVEGTQKFNFDLLSYIGAFTCWKWIQGLALFIAPFEFLFPGEIIGVYIGNVVISIATMYMLYMVLHSLIANINSIVCALSTLFLFLCPYELGLFSYLNMDSHLALFVVWLIYYKLQDDDVMISFCGFLLAFTKITGMCFYGVYLLTNALHEIYTQDSESILGKFNKWWSTKKVIMWLLPVAMFMFFFWYGGRFTMLNFFGTYQSDSMLKFSLDVSAADVFVQSFVYGFRWLLLAVLMIVLVYRKGKIDSVTRRTKVQYVAVASACIAVVMLLIVYNSDANCPRYTAILNIMYVMSFSLIINELYWRRVQISAAIVGIGIMFIQLFITIDPAIIYTTDAIELGHTKIYRLAVKADQRSGMTIGRDYATHDYTQCDIFCYNLQFAYADPLIESLLEDIKVSEKDKIFVLDEYEYEYHISGSWHRNYKIYWDNQKKRRTYEKANNIYVDVNNLSTDEILYWNETKNNELPRMFYMIVPARVDEKEAVSLLNNMGYIARTKHRYENFYGYIDLYKIEKQGR